MLFSICVLKGRHWCNKGKGLFEGHTIMWDICLGAASLILFKPFIYFSGRGHTYATM